MSCPNARRDHHWPDFGTLRPSRGFVLCRSVEHSWELLYACAFPLAWSGSKTTNHNPWMTAGSRVDRETCFTSASAWEASEMICRNRTWWHPC